MKEERKDNKDVRNKETNERLRRKKVMEILKMLKMIIFNNWVFLAFHQSGFSTKAQETWEAFCWLFC